MDNLIGMCWGSEEEKQRDWNNMRSLHSIVKYLEAKGTKYDDPKETYTGLYEQYKSKYGIGFKRTLVEESAQN